MTVRKRADHWHHDFQVAGRRYRAAIPEARTKAQAERAESRAREEVYQAKYGDQPRRPITFGEFVREIYAPIARETTRNYTTNAGYQAGKLTEQFGDRPIAEITHFEIEKWLLTLRDKYAPATINHFIKRAKVVFGRAAAEGFIDPEKNPSRLLSKIEETPRAKRRLSREEEEKIAAAAAGLGLEYVASAMMILLETGMRPQEFLLMRQSQVNLAEGIVTAISYKSGRRRAATAQPKSRDIPLTARVRAEFEQLLGSSLAGSGEDDRLFPFDSIRKAWDSCCKRAGIEEFWLRWCRDEAASRWAEAGMDPFTIARLLGHSSPRTSMIYVRAWRDETLRKMESVTNPSQGQQRQRAPVIVNS